MNNDLYDKYNGLSFYGLLEVVGQFEERFLELQEEKMRRVATIEKQQKMLQRAENRAARYSSKIAEMRHDMGLASNYIAPNGQHENAVLVGLKYMLQTYGDGLIYNGLDVTKMISLLEHPEMDTDGDGKAFSEKVYRSTLSFLSRYKPIKHAPVRRHSDV